MPTLILVHGAGAASRMWRGVRPLLEPAFEVVTPDLPGFGTQPGPFTVDGAVAALAALAEQHGPPVHLCGFSLGAVVAAELAAARPELVDRLVLAGISVTPAATGQRWIRFYRRVPWFAMRPFAGVPDRAAWLAVVDAIEGIDVRPVLPRIARPTLATCGGRDRGSLTDTAVAAGAIPGATHLVVPHLGHMWPVAAPKVFATVLTGFLTG